MEQGKPWNSKEWELQYISEVDIKLYSTKSK